MEDSTLDKTALSTISLLEARLLRIEQLLYGNISHPTPQPPADSVSGSLALLERRFANIVSRFRVYGDILKLCTTPLFSYLSFKTGFRSIWKCHEMLT